MTGFDSKRQMAQAKLEPTQWRDMVVVTLVREGIDKHKARELADHFAAQPEQEPVTYDKTEMNGFVQELYDKKMQEGKHGHYETMFHVVHQAIKRVAQRPWVGLTDDDIAQAMYKADAIFTGPMQFKFAKELEAKLKEKNDH